ncbi:hypothetical protein, partial [Klebsiella pneumoniae]|uniref:hypothetical protein n=1 Tax=Klebsiella pneumoniae TaxID=573 RepID=UPI003013E28A
YNEGNLDVYQGGDLLAAQFAAYRAYAALQAERRAPGLAADYAAKAAALRATFNATWWDEDRRFFYGARLQDGTFYPRYHDVA